MVKRDENGRFTSEIGQVSDLATQIAETQAKLEKLQKEQAAQIEAERRAQAEVRQSERKVDLEKVQSAANAYLKVVNENKKVRQSLDEQEAELYQAYKNELDAFARKHNNYHLSYTVNGDNIEFQLEEARANSFAAIRKEQADFIRNFWDGFFSF